MIIRNQQHQLQTRLDMLEDLVNLTDLECAEVYGETKEQLLRNQINSFRHFVVDLRN